MHTLHRRLDGNQPNMRPTSDNLHAHVGSLVDLGAAMMAMAEMAPERMSVSQVIFFITAATADLAGKRPTFSEMRNSLGEDINRTLHATYRVLLEPSRAYPKGLGWLTRERNPADNREWFLKLTPKGRLVIKEVLRALGRNPTDLRHSLQLPVGR